MKFIVRVEKTTKKNKNKNNNKTNQTKTALGLNDLIYTPKD